jgi:hypothetical protein
MTPIYLDYNASTPVDPAVVAAMRPFLDEAFGNPSSGHWASTPAKATLEQARCQVAVLLGAAPEEIVFTSGGSEANNLAVKGTLRAKPQKSAHYHLGHRASRCSCPLSVSRTARRFGHLFSGGPDGPGRSRARAPRHYSADGLDQHHARQQRSRHHPADRGNRMAIGTPIGRCWTI